LNAAGIGLWDVIGRCERRGSLDADIVRGTEVANALPELIATLPELELIGCNGGRRCRHSSAGCCPAGGAAEAARAAVHQPGQCGVVVAAPAPGLAAGGRRAGDMKRTSSGQYATDWSRPRPMGNSLSRLRAY
jgi:hypothetical protein